MSIQDRSCPASADVLKSFICNLSSIVGHTMAVTGKAVVSNLDHHTIDLELLKYCAGRLIEMFWYLVLVVCKQKGLFGL
ncbi:unnamed protein product [Leptosia nina]|uniref:Uncharacterized protein n=1 Tax=Leptosia nina TaxID=320188 RepID=A0AAV1J0T7_9NEOP